MPRAATTTDAFNAVGDPRRREIIDLLAEKDGRSVGELVDALGIPQPAVSKHLGVLRQVGLVTVVRNGQSRIYCLRAEKLKAMHDWTQTFERFWSDQLDAIKKAAERKARERESQKQQDGHSQTK